MSLPCPIVVSNKQGLAFIKDPDGYLIEVLPQGEMIAEPVDCLGVAADGGEGYKDNSK